MDPLEIIQVFIYLVKIQSRFLGDWIFPPIRNYHPGFCKSLSWITLPILMSFSGEDPVSQIQSQFI